MPKNKRWLLVIDLETDHKLTDLCNIVELAAVPIDPDTLEIKSDQTFSVHIKPPGINKEDYLADKDRVKTIQWHAKNHGITVEEVVEKWKKGVAEKTALKNFCTYCAKYVVDKGPGLWYPEPIPGGYNITGFDLPILQRLMDKHKLKMPVSTVTKVDAMDNLFWWFENLDEPHDFRMDTWREFFGLKSNGLAHEALTDVFDEAKIIQRFLKFHRKQARVDKFKGSFSS